MNTTLWYCLLGMVTVLGREAGAFWWPFSGEEEDSEPATAMAPSEPVAFETASVEQKFLAEAQQYLNLPPLEACQHHVSVCSIT